LTNTGDGDAFIVKYDSGGNVQWAKSAVGVAGADDVGFAVACDNAGNIFWSGDFESAPLTIGKSGLKSCQRRGYFCC
jgi:hypothetical protein